MSQTAEQASRWTSKLQDGLALLWQQFPQQNEHQCHGKTAIAAYQMRTVSTETDCTMRAGAAMDTEADEEQAALAVLPVFCNLWSLRCRWRKFDAP
eukprot:6213319-Pleurochrysis_carterae.AAC.1